MNELFFLNNGIETLKVNNEIFTKLIKNNILTVFKLWELNRKQLKNMNFTDDEINQIIVRMQLHGFDLNKKIYNKD